MNILLSSSSKPFFFFFYFCLPSTRKVVWFWNLASRVWTAEATQNIFYMKGVGTAYNCSVTRWLKKIRSGCRSLDDQARSGRPQSVDSDAVLQAIEVNLAKKNSESIRWVRHLAIQYTRFVQKILSYKRIAERCFCCIALHYFVFS